MKLKNLFKPVIVAVFLGFCLYAIGCGGSSGGTTNNPLGAGPGALILTGKVVTTDPFPGQIIANNREDLLTKDLRASVQTPVSGADVWLEKHPMIYARTNASGEYQLDGVPAGEHNIVAKAYNNSRSTTYKMRVNATTQSNLPENQQPDILLKEAKNYVTGVLRDSNGNPLPAGTNLTLWGESFTVGNDGKFTSPPLPESFTEENIILPSNALSDEVFIKAAFISDSAPPEIEVFVPEKGKPGNSAPIVFLTSRKGGVPASKVSPNEQLTLTAEAFDPDAVDASRLVIYWSSDKGSLATNSAQPFQAVWTAPDHPGMATIEIRVYDAQGAYGAVKLKILVGLDSPPTGPADIVSPIVEAISPASGAVDVAVNAITTVTFNEFIATLTVNTSSFVLKSNDTSITGSVALNPDGKSATFRPTESLPAGSVITIIFGGIKDLAGNPLISDVYSYTTETERDTTAPSVVSVAPVEDATNIGVDAKITVTFSEAMDTSTINATTFTVASGGIAIAGSISFSGDGSVATFTPSSSLPTGALISVTVTTGIKDSAGNAIPSNKIWRFATIPTPDTTAPTNQDTVLAASVTVKGGDAVTIISSSDANNTVWLAPAGTTVFVESTTITKAGGTATSINAPADEGAYKLFIIDAAGNVSAASIATVTVDNTAPTNQDTVLAASVTVKGGTAVTIISSSDANNTVWLAPAGTTVFTESATMTKAGGIATSINAPVDEGAYKLFVIDAVGNISAASAATVTVDNTAPVVSAPTNVAQLLRSGQTSTSTIQSNEAGKIYFIKNGEVAATQTDIDAAIASNMAFLAKDSALANSPYTVTVPSVAEGLYDLVALDVAGNLSAIASGWLTVGIDYTSPNIGFLKYVPGGTFHRDGNPANTTTVSAFRMSQYEITQSQFTSVTGLANPSHFTGVVNGPVDQANWYHAIVFCNQLSIIEGLTPAYTISGSTNPADWGSVPTNPPSLGDLTWNAAICNWNATGYRLPTEAEWQWAAMGATDSYLKAFAGSTGSNLIGDFVWYSDNAGGTTHPIGSKNANELGIYDMSGNVKEWCWDWYDAYPAGALTNPVGAAPGSYRVFRGGSWWNLADAVTVANRMFDGPVIGYTDMGLRVVRP